MTIRSRYPVFSLVTVMAFVQLMDLETMIGRLKREMLQQQSNQGPPGNSKWDSALDIHKFEQLGGNGPSSALKMPTSTVGNCSAEQKGAIFNQTHRTDAHGIPTMQQSLTNCPDSSNWLEDFYLNSQQKNTNSFLAINIGCNKGYDSLDLLRMGTRQPSVLKQPWKESAFKGAKPACGTSKGDIDLKLPQNSTPVRGDVYCVEPMPTTIKALQNASEATSMEEKGLHIVHAALSNEIGTAQFPVMPKAGIEYLGLGGHKDKKASYQYQDVPLMTLDEFGKRHMSQHSNNQRINVLLIDTEGYDFEVMKGGETMMKNVEYLEFEFHQVGKWRQQNLKDAIDMLDDWGFTCYWSGKKKLWRITKCWLDHFKHHQWSNVACVHTNNKPDLAMKMEQVFLQTIDQE